MSQLAPTTHLTTPSWLREPLAGLGEASARGAHPSGSLDRSRCLLEHISRPHRGCEMCSTRLAPERPASNGNIHRRPTVSHYLLPPLGVLLAAILFSPSLLAQQEQPDATQPPGVTASGMAVSGGARSSASPEDRANDSSASASSVTASSTQSSSTDRGTATSTASAARTDSSAADRSEPSALSEPEDDDAEELATGSDREVAPDHAETARGRRFHDAARYRSTRYGAIELRIGPYRPEVDSEFGDGPGPFAELFGSGPSIAFAFEADWQAIQIPHFGSFGPGFSAGYVHYGAGALLEADPSQRSPQPTALWIIPTYGVAVLRVDVLARDFGIPIVPYAKAGFSMNIWEATDAGDGTDYAGVSSKGTEFGVVGMLGGMLLLDFFAPQAAVDMDNTTGVNHAYLFGEWMVSDVSTFGSGMQTGTNTWQVGLTLEY